jgi:NADP-dependent 3-hydroxy acid dehydrogenase YdfG
VAELFAQEGAIVYAGSSSNPSGIFPAGVTGVELDVSKEEHWKRVVADIVAAHRRVDVLVNNAGTAVDDAVHDCSTENWRKVLAVNQDGCFFGMREVIPHMQAHRSGSIINVSSIWGTAAVPGAHAYHAIKGALVMISKTCRHHLCRRPNPREFYPSGLHKHAADTGSGPGHQRLNH